MAWTIELARARDGLGGGVPLPVTIDDLDNIEGCQLRANGWA